MTSRPMPERWEYKVLTAKDYDYISLEKELNKLGSEGWEIVPGTYATRSMGSGIERAERLEAVILRRVKVMGGEA